MKTNIDLDAFVRLLRQGNMFAHESLFRLYYEKLLHIAKGYLGTMEDAEEIVQNVFLKIWERKEHLKIDSSVNNYLFTMVKNACLDQLKHEKVKISFSRNYYEEKIAIQYQFVNDEAASSLLESELEKRIMKAIESLPKKCRKVFVKSRLEGMKHSEIAEVLHISKRTVDNHICNALKHMKLQLREFLTLFLLLQLWID